MNDEYFMNMALKEAYKAYEKGEVPVGAVIVLNNKIIAKAHNLRETKKDITKHAELIAIKKASLKIDDWRLQNSVMYVTLFPCPMCASAITQSRIKKVVVGSRTKDSNIYHIGKEILKGNSFCPKVEVTEDILTEQCVNLLSMFFKKQRTK